MCKEIFQTPAPATTAFKLSKIKAEVLTSLFPPCLNLFFPPPLCSTPSRKCPAIFYTKYKIPRISQGRSFVKFLQEKPSKANQDLLQLQLQQALGSKHQRVADIFILQPFNRQQTVTAQSPEQWQMKVGQPGVSVLAPAGDGTNCTTRDLGSQSRDLTLPRALGLSETIPSSRGVANSPGLARDGMAAWKHMEWKPREQRTL